MRISDWSSDVCSSDLAIRRDVEICASVVAPSPGREQPCDADGVAFSSFRHGVLRARVDEPSNCERRCGHLGWDIECSQDLGQMDRLYLEPAGHDASEVEVASRIVAAERQPARSAEHTSEIQSIMRIQ